MGYKVCLISALNSTIPITPFFSQHDGINSCVVLQKALLQSDVITNIFFVREHLMLSGIVEVDVGAQDVDVSCVSDIYSYIK